MSRLSEPVNVPLKITLVHGTWGRGMFFPKDAPLWGTFWFNEKSVFRQQLEDELKKRNISYQIDCANWSGSNSILARAQAATELRERLTGHSASGRVAVIGHSHGGNVAMRAVSEMGRAGASVHLSTLATPFLRLYPTWSGPSFWQQFNLVVVVVLAAFGLVFPNPKDVRPEVPLLAAFLVLLPLCVLITRFYFNPGTKTPPGAKENPWAWRPFTLASAANYDFTKETAPLLLVVRGVGDEASLSMAASKAGARLSYLITNFTMNNIAFYFTIPAAIATWLGADAVSTVVQRIAGVGISTGVTLLLLPNVLATVFGREFLFGTMRCEASVESVPEGASAKVVTLPPTSFDPYKQYRLRHCIYDEPACATEIIAWWEESGLIAAGSSLRDSPAPHTIGST